MNHTHCKRCARPLTSDRSRARGYGPTCARRQRDAAAGLTEYKPAQLDAAWELIDDGGILTLRTGRVWLTVSTDGTAVHRTALNACTCPAGLRGTRCYHTAAAHILAA